MIVCSAILIVFLAVFLGGTLGRLALTSCNLRHLRRNGHRVPDELKGALDEGTLSRMTSYTIESSRCAMWEGLAGDAATLAILLSGVLPWYTGLLEAAAMPYVITGLLFLAAPAAVGVMLEIPFELVRTFVIEKRYGFSTITGRLWITDFVKGLIISATVGAIIIGALLALIRNAAETWWLWGWLLFALFQLFVLWLYPIFIAPLFNTYEPLKDEALRTKIQSLIAKTNFRAREILQMDAARRSTHSNAYFTGLGRTRRIVLYDTLLASHPHDEILSILAHEVGHWKKRHLLRQIILLETLSFTAFYLFSLLITWEPLYRTFGFAGPAPHTGVLLVSVVAGSCLFYLKPGAAMVSRHYETEADRFAGELIGSTEPLIEALKRLAQTNLANLYPHPLYAWFFYSHPPMLKRIALLREQSLKSH